jgi:hypothetical protein
MATSLVSTQAQATTNTACAPVVFICPDKLLALSTEQAFILTRHFTDFYSFWRDHVEAAAWFPSHGITEECLWNDMGLAQWARKITKITLPYLLCH